MPQKITVVGQAPFPVTLPDGSQVSPGEVRQNIEHFPEIDEAIAEGTLREAEPLVKDEAPAAPAPTTRKSRTEDDSKEQS